MLHTSIADDTSNRGISLPLYVRHASLALLCLLFMLFCYGIRKATDPALPQYFIDLMAGRESHLPASAGFLFEGSLGDLVAFGFTLLIHNVIAVTIVWWAVGVLLCVGACTSLWRSRRIGLPVLLACVVFSHAIDTSLLWVGKLDGFLLCCLCLVLHPNRKVSTVAILSAPFFHPHIAFLSITGLALVSGVSDRRIRWDQIALSGLAAGVDLICFHLFFPDLHDRSGFFTSKITYIIVNGLHYGVLNIIAGFMAPMGLLFVATGCPKLSFDIRVGMLCAWLVGVVAITSFLTLDHTRDLFLITFVPLLGFVDHITRSHSVSPPRPSRALLIALLIARLGIPHVDSSGLVSFNWTYVWKQMGIAQIAPSPDQSPQDDPL